LKLVAVAWQSS